MNKTIYLYGKLHYVVKLEFYEVLIQVMVCRQIILNWDIQLVDSRYSRYYISNNLNTQLTFQKGFKKYTRILYTYGICAL